MQLSMEQGDGYTIQSYAPGEIKIKGQIYHHSVLISALMLAPWPPQTVADIDENSLTLLIQTQPKIVIIGTGESHVFLPPSLLAPLINQGIGIETMTTAAACRTYNILVAEKRAVVAGLIM